jgi:hypothetical protein
MISLIKLLNEVVSSPQHFGTSTAGGQPLPSSSIDYNVSSEFSDFEAKIARTTAESKASFLKNLNNRVFGKKVSIQASKGYGQPVRDYEISVTSTSLDYFYDRYVVILRDDDDKEYFLKPGFKITILGQGDPLKVEKPKEPKSAEPGTKATTKGGENAIKTATPMPQQQYVAQPQQQYVAQPQQQKQA